MNLFNEQEPLISTVIHGGSGRVFLAGEILRGELQVDLIEPGQIEALELSILWMTEGKGDEDLGIHYFQRLTRPRGGPQNLHQLRPFEVRLPEGPLSYDGRLIKLRWLVRVRLFLEKGREFVADRPFHLGHVPAPPSVLTATTTDDEQHPSNPSSRDSTAIDANPLTVNPVEAIRPRSVARLRGGLASSPITP